MQLSSEEQHWLDGRDGPAMALAMRLMVAAAEASGAQAFVPIDFAHINSCHWSGRLSVDFAEFLLEHDARPRVPTHTNASLIDRSRPGCRPAERDPEAVAGARRLMEIYEALGCSSIWTCAPYQQPEARPTFGQQIVGSESNAVSFYNSVLGARTNKYGDFLDICGALLGRVPLAGLHTDGGRRATHVVDVRTRQTEDPTLPHLLGAIIGRSVSTGVPAVLGLEKANEDDLKAVAAAAATSGAVAMFHVVGITPEAPTAADAGVTADLPRTLVDDDRLDEMRAELSHLTHGRLDAVCLGTPHYSAAEFERVVGRLAGRRVAATTRLIITTSRAVEHLLRLNGSYDHLVGAGVDLVTDTCSYYLPRLDGVQGAVMTDSAKWVLYAPGMLGVDVAFGSLEDCVESAVAGEVVRT